jgi:hypothetical protein
MTAVSRVHGHGSRRGSARVVHTVPLIASARIVSAFALESKHPSMLAGAVSRNAEGSGRTDYGPAASGSMGPVHVPVYDVLSEL